MFVTAALAAAVLQAQPVVLHKYEGLSLTNDGTAMVTVETSGPLNSQMLPHGVVTVRNLAGAVQGQLDPCAACRYSDPTWSPDGKSLAFIAADAKAGTVTLYVAANGKTRILTTVTGVADRPRWSPDGKSIALQVVVGAHKQVGATQAGARQVGEIGLSSGTDEQRVGIVDIATGGLKLVTPEDTWVYEYDWMPDGTGFVATAAKGDGDNNWWTAKLEAFGLDGSERIIAAPKMQLNFPRVAPDGKTVLFIGGLMSDFGPVGGDVYSVPLAGGEPVNVTPDYKGTFSSLAVTKTGVIASVILGGETGVASLNDGKVTVLSHGEVSTSAGDARIAVSADGKTAAAVVEGFTTAQQIQAGPLGAMTAVTHDNDAVKLTYTTKSVTWQHDGFDVQGWLMIPAGVDPNKTYPMVTIVHGGPASAVTPRFTPQGAAVELLNAGYYVFQPNPRGSYGQGEAFTRANVRDFGGADLGDIMSGIDAVEKVAPVDEARLGIMGHSYGGFMTMWTVTHSHRFKAAVAGAGIANWSSYYGENGIDQWMIPFFGASFYDDPAIYDKLSPIRTIKDATTPTFIYVGERDVECPAPQSMEFWHGLKAMGVETSLVIYDGEGHGIRAPEHVKDLSDRTAAWFGKYLGVGGR